MQGNIFGNKDTKMNMVYTHIELQKQCMLQCNQHTMKAHTHTQVVFFHNVHFIYSQSKVKPQYKTGSGFQTQWHVTIWLTWLLTQHTINKITQWVEVNKPNVKSACGHTVELSHLSGLGQLSTLTPYDVQAVKILAPFRHQSGSLWRQLPFQSGQT